MTIDTQCYVCGVEMLCIDGLCPDCQMREFFNPGAAFAATFGAVTSHSVECPDCGAKTERTTDANGYDVDYCAACGWQRHLPDDSGA